MSEHEINYFIDPEGADSITINVTAPRLTAPQNYFIDPDGADSITIIDVAAPQVTAPSNQPSQRIVPATTRSPGRTRVSQRSRRPATMRGPVLTLTERRELQSQGEAAWASNTAARTSSTAARVSSTTTSGIATARASSTTTSGITTARAFSTTTGASSTAASGFSSSSLLFEDIESSDDEIAPIKDDWNMVDVPSANNDQFQDLLGQATSLGFRYKPISFHLPQAGPVLEPSTAKVVDNTTLVNTSSVISEDSHTPDHVTPDVSSTVAQGSRSTTKTQLDGLAPPLKQYLQDTIPTAYIGYCNTFVFPNKATHSAFAQIVFGRLVNEACKHMNPPLMYGFKNNSATQVKQNDGPAVSINDIVMFMGNIAPKTFSNYKTNHLKALSSLTKLRAKAREMPDSLSEDAQLLFDHVKELLTTPLSGLHSLDPQRYMSAEKFRKRVLLVFPKAKRCSD